MKNSKLKRVLKRLGIILLCLAILPLSLLIYAKVVVPIKFENAEQKFMEETTQYYYEHQEELNDFVRKIENGEILKHTSESRYYPDSSYHVRCDLGGDRNIAFERTDLRSYGGYAMGGILYSPIDKANQFRSTLSNPGWVIPIEGDWYMYFYRY